MLTQAGDGATPGEPTWDWLALSDLPPHSHKPEDIDPQGEGSGLDADKLDGVEGDDYALKKWVLQQLAAQPATPSVPAGTIHAYGGTTAPAGYLMCDGTSYLRTDYPSLFAAIGTAFGAADSTHFNVPDLRGRFLRGEDAMGGLGSGRDQGPTRTEMNPGGNLSGLGTVQGDATKRPNAQFSTDSHLGHTHTIFGTDHNHRHYTDPSPSPQYTLGNSGAGPVWVASLLFATAGAPWSSWIADGATSHAHGESSAGAHSHVVNGGGDGETCPKNAAVYYIIRV